MRSSVANAQVRRLMDLASIRMNARPLQHMHSVDICVHRSVHPKVEGTCAFGVALGGPLLSQEIFKKNRITT
jgi:hypothetical protein